ncbi:MAG: hypothetical protein AB8I08_27405 [Sandaracinaceae bacterium]
MTLEELLDEIDAPELLVLRAREEDWDVDDAWGRTMPAAHRMWLAACSGAPIEALIEAAASAVWTASEEFKDVPEMLAATVSLAVEGAPSARLLEAATACEQLAGTGASYRSARSPGFEALVRAAALVAHAAEGLTTGKARREAARLEQARRTGALIGAGAHVALPTAEGPPRLNVPAAGSDPAQGAFLFASAAAAESVRECADALEQAGSDPDVLRPVVQKTLEDGS